MLDPNRFDLKNLLDSGYMNPMTALRSQFGNPERRYNGEPTQVLDPDMPPPPQEPKSILVPQPMLGIQQRSGGALSGLMT